MQFPKEQIDLVRAGFEMREAQQNYFHERTQYRLRIAKQKEQTFDRLLQLQIAAGVIKVEQKHSVEQKDLFV
ncbi:MAG: hypothetical protein C0459_03285 [Chitinophaga sp.]|jgi:ribosomal protein S10|nr:hypothetical protein [Chitinophaga sp.]